MSSGDLQKARAAMKLAASSGLQTNENETDKGTIDVYPTPPGRAPGTLDAKWGDMPPQGPNGNPAIYGTAVVSTAKDTREDMLERLFSSPSTSAPAEQALMGSLFEHAREGDPHSPLLRRNRQEKNASDESLREQVARIIR